VLHAIKVIFRTNVQVSCMSVTGITIRLNANKKSGLLIQLLKQTIGDIFSV